MATHSSILTCGGFHGQRSLAGYSPWDCKELNTTEWQSFSLWFSKVQVSRWFQRLPRHTQAPVQSIVLEDCSHTYLVLDLKEKGFNFSSLTMRYYESLFLQSPVLDSFCLFIYIYSPSFSTLLGAQRLMSQDSVSQAPLPHAFQLSSNNSRLGV